MTRSGPASAQAPRAPLALAATAAALLLLGACTTTGRPAESRAVSAPVDPAPADPERRAKVRLELAGLYFGRGQPQTALEEVDRALAAKPDLAAAHGLRGLIEASLGQPAEAERSFARALSLAPRDAATRHNYGWFLCQQQRWADADAQFAAAVAEPLYRDVVRTLLAQGVCLARAGRWADADRALARSFELDPSNPTTAYNLAEVLLHRGELDRARFYVQRVNARPEQVTAQSLWLAARIERRLGNLAAVQEIGARLHQRFADATETMQFDRGRFDD